MYDILVSSLSFHHMLSYAVMRPMGALQKLIWDIKAHISSFGILNKVHAWFLGNCFCVGTQYVWVCVCVCPQAIKAIHVK